MGKLGGWETLAALAPDLGPPVELFTTLAERAREHADLFGRLHHHVGAARSALRGKKYDDDNSPTANAPAVSE